MSQSFLYSFEHAVLFNGKNVKNSNSNTMDAKVKRYCKVNCFCFRNLSNKRKPSESHGAINNLWNHLIYRPENLISILDCCKFIDARAVNIFLISIMAFVFDFQHAIANNKAM